MVKKLTVVVVLCSASVAWAQGDVSQDVPGHGQINWTAKTITATGTGAPDLKAPNAAVARIGAERVARMDALRNVLEAVKGAKISGTTKAEGLIAESPQLNAKVQGVVRNFKVLDIKYYSDGGVDIIVEVPLSGVTEALVTDAGASPHKGKKPGDGTTGVIINAKGLAVAPGLAPRIYNEGGDELYGAQVVNKNAIRQYGVAGYTRSLDKAMKDTRVSGKPLVIKALRVPAKGSADVVVAKNDAAKLASLTGLLGQGKVIFVTD